MRAVVITGTFCVTAPGEEKKKVPSRHMTPFPSKIPHPLFSFSTNDLLLLKGLYAVYTTILLLEIVIQMQFVIFIFFSPRSLLLPHVLAFSSSS